MNLDDLDKFMIRRIAFGLYERHGIPTLHRIKQEVQGVAEAAAVLAPKGRFGCAVARGLPEWALPCQT